MGMTSNPFFISCYRCAGSIQLVTGMGPAMGQKGWWSCEREKFKSLHPNDQMLQRQAGGPAGRAEPTPLPVDDEAFGGYVEYLTIVETARGLGGELEGLVVRYNPLSPPTATATDAD